MISPLTGPASGEASLTLQQKCGSPNGYARYDGIDHLRAYCVARRRLNSRHIFSCQRQRPLVSENKSIQHASPNRKTKFVPPAEELQEKPLPSDPKVSCLKLLTC